MNTDTYSDLNINQRINAKANRFILYPSASRSENLIRRMKTRLAGIFSPESLLLESPGIHNNRNYDGPSEVDYNGWSQGEQDERMAKIQREIK